MAHLNGKTISILGCGWYGQALALHLMRHGVTVKGSTTSPAKLESLKQQSIIPYLIDLNDDSTAAAYPDFFKCDVLVIAFNVRLDKRQNYLKEIELLNLLCNQHGVKKAIFISSTSVYGSAGVQVEEPTVPEPETNSAKALYAAENLLAANDEMELTVIRFGGLVGSGRMPGRFLSGKKDLPNGLAPVNLIALEDCIGLTEMVIVDQPELNLINGVSPDHPTRKDFYQLACELEGLPQPDFLLERTEWKIVGSNYPELYKYQVTDWLSWLKTTTSNQD